jgi:DNA-binding LacI/PurR family transcriptional regulator
VEDVARVAGVSRQTVSRVLNEHPHVAPGTRRRVRAAMDELRWAPDPAARALGRRSGARSVALAGVVGAGEPIGGRTAIAELRSSGFAVLEIPVGSSPELVAQLLVLDDRPGVVVVLV